GMLGVGKAKAATVLGGEAVLQDDDPLILDALAADVVEGTGVLGLGLVLQSDLEIMPGVPGASVHLVVAGRGEMRKMGNAFRVLGERSLNCLGELDGLDGLPRLGLGRRIGGPEIGDYLMERRGLLHEEDERWQGELSGNVVEQSLRGLGFA